MSRIGTVQDAMLTAARAALASTVKSFGTLPGPWTLDDLKRALQAAPGVYVSFTGGTAAKNGSDLDAGFALFIVVKGAREAARREGTLRDIGAYDIIDILCPRLNGLPVADLGSLTLKSVDNLFQAEMFDLGGTVYGLAFTLPNMPFADVTAFTAGTLADFVTYHAEHRLDPTSPDPDVTDELTL